MTEALRNKASDAELVYFDELKQAATKLKVLKQRITKAEREARKAGNIHWGHVMVYYHPTSGRVFLADEGLHIGMTDNGDLKWLASF